MERLALLTAQSLTNESVIVLLMARPSDPQARARLLSAARKVFVDKGLDRAKVEDITQAAGLSKGSFYLHFKSKEQAFTEILAEALNEVGDIVTQGHAAHEEHYKRGLKHMVTHWLERDIAVFEVIWKHRAVMALVLLAGGGSADYQHLTETFVQRLERQVENLIAFGVRQGYYRSDVEPGVAAAFCSGGFDRVAREMLRAKRKPDLPRLMRQAHSYVIHAFGTDELIAVAEELYGTEPSPVSGLARAVPGRRTSRSA
jgi:AcrR family transcriptional regulator